MPIEEDICPKCDNHRINCKCGYFKKDKQDRQQSLGTNVQEIPTDIKRLIL